MQEDDNNASYSFDAYYYIPASAFDEKGKLQMSMTYNLENYSTAQFVVTNKSSLKTFLHKVHQVSFSGVNLVLTGEEDDCSDWNFRIDYNFETFTKIKATLNTKSYPCPDDEGRSTKVAQTNTVMMIGLLLCAVMGLYHSWKNIYETGINYMTLRYIRKKQRLKIITGQASEESSFFTVIATIL
jgi:hypothetical protein